MWQLLTVSAGLGLLLIVLCVELWAGFLLVFWWLAFWPGVKKPWLIRPEVPTWGRRDVQIQDIKKLKHVQWSSPDMLDEKPLMLEYASASKKKKKTVSNWHISLFTSPCPGSSVAVVNSEMCQLLTVSAGLGLLLIVLCVELWAGRKTPTYLLTIYNRKKYFRTDSLTRIPYKIKEQLIRSQACLNHLFFYSRFDASLYSAGTQHEKPLGGGDSSVVRAPDSWFKGRGFESLQERRENFLLQGRLSVLTLVSVSVPSPYYRSST